MSTVQRALAGGPINNASAGQWRIIAKPWGLPELDVTTFRGEPTGVGDFVFSDPFGAVSMSLTLPQVTIFEQRGVGDLYWLTKHVDIDVIWEGPLPNGFAIAPSATGDTRVPKWRWEGYLSSFGVNSSSGLTVQAKGAGLQLDDWLAKPEYPGRPLPYEWAIARQFLHKPALRLAPLRIIWPTGWAHQFVPPVKVPSYLMPAGVSKGENWTGLLTRSTGSWDPVLTSYIQTLLSSMYDEQGRWTIDFDAGRQPVMFRRPFVAQPDATTVAVDMAAPGVEVDLAEDWEQSLTTVYGQGTSLSGVAFSGMSVSSDGAQTSYVPLAYQRQVYPDLNDNAWLDRSVMVKEVLLQMQPGLSADDAAIVARAHLSRFSEPGVTGTITLSSDPLVNGVRVPRHLVRAGMTVHLPRALGRPGGVLVHITGSTHSIASGKVTLSVDSKFRDALTSEEVRLRGRDALSISRMLVAGQYQPPVSDQMMPWSYDDGSGVVPSNPVYDATRLFLTMPSQTQFPWTDWTTTHPPRDAKWRSCYLRLGPAQANADGNWITQQTVTGTAFGVPVKMSQAGSIRLLQFAAYDAYGNVLKVPFHVSLYYVGGVNVMSMPRIPADQAALFPPYQAGQHYPFVRDGFEAFKIDGTRNDPNVPQPTESVGLIRAYGTFYQKAGYWPGAYADGDAATGLLVDESTWSFDVTSVSDASWDPYSAERNLTNPKAGKIYAMIYCDAQATQEVFFLGRMFRAEPGSGGN